jgi:hypothetical protein
MNKYEQLIEYIINDQEDKARELFHNIVVEKSRDIYESIMDEEQVEETVDQYDQGGDLADNIQADETMESDDDMELEIGADGMGDEEGFGGDDLGGDDFGGDDIGGEGDVEGKFQDIKSAIDELQAEFDKLMGGEGDGQSGTGSDEFGGDEGGDDFGGEEGGDDQPEDEEMFAEGENPFAKKGSGSGKSGSGASGSGKAGSGKSGSGKSGSGKAMTETEMMREYVEKISAPANTEGTAVGTGNKTPKVSVNTKNPLAGKNDMGGSAKNIANGKSDAGDVDGNSPKGKAGGFVKPAQEIDVAKRNVNKVGGNKGAQDWYNTKAKGKDAEGSTTDGSVSVNKNSLEGGK